MLCTMYHHCSLRSFPTRRSSDLDSALSGQNRQNQKPERSSGLSDRSNSARIQFALRILCSFTYEEQRRKYDLSRRNESGYGKKRSEEHTSELQSRENIVCRLLLE